MQPISPTSAIFSSEQKVDFSIEYWDTPFSVLESDVASGGIPFDLREPDSTGAFTTKSAVDGASAGTDATYGTAANAAFAGSTSRSVVADGRLPNLIGYWAGGAPGYHGASVQARVAYHFRLYLRSTTGRGWFSSATNPTFSLAFAGSGYFRIDKRVGSTVTNLYKGTLAESDFTVNGYTFTPVISNMAAGDYLDVFYIQNQDPWGGFVVKAVAGSTQTNALAQAAPVVGCGLFDDNAPPTKRMVTMVDSVTVGFSVGSSAQATFAVPLIKPAMTDNEGWEWYQASVDNPPVLRAHDPGVTSFDLKHQRLVRIKGGFANEQYTLFTGFIDDFEEESGLASVRCLGFEQRLLEQFVKNYPDPISYMAFGYQLTSGQAQPVYPILAYDNWALEYVLRDLMVRAGLDESKVMRNLTVTQSDGTTSTVTYGGDTYKKFRARTLAGEFLTLPRPVHYGNTGAVFNELIPPDDAYLFPPDDTRELWNRCRELTDRLGYDFRFDEFGDAWLQPPNNPHYVQSVTGGGGTVQTNPSAYAGDYREYSGTVSLFTTSVTAARIDLSVPLGPSLGSWTFTVKRASDSTVMATGTIVPASTDTIFFYDYQAVVDGTNATVATLFSGEYDTYNVELSSSGGSATRRLDCFFLYHTDPAHPLFPDAFSTDLNALKVTARSAMGDMRNHVIVVGRRTAAVTDSAKLDTNPRNPESEFVVERAVDVASIVDPTASNFVGFPKESLIYDETIADRDMAGYIARVFIYRQRMPLPNASIEHTLVPALQLRDPVYATNAGIQTLDNAVVYVSQIQHRIEKGQAITTLEATSYPPYPAFEPRDEIDVDAAFGGSPVVNVEVKYTGLNGTTKTNLGTGVVAIADGGVLKGDAPVGGSGLITKSVTAGSPPYLDMSGQDWPPIPGSVQIRVNGTGSGATSSQATDTGHAPLPKSGMFNEMLGQINQTATAPLRLERMKSIDTVTAIADWHGNVSAVGTKIGQYPFHWEWNPETETITVYCDTRPNSWEDSELTFHAHVVWTQAADGFHTGWLANNPNHHFMNVDYRDANRKIYLPWEEGDGGTAYNRIGSITSFDVRYRRLGTSAGSFSDPYSGSSPFYDPYTSELGYLVQIGFDAMLSGHYRIAVCNANDDTVVAWLTSTTASPDDAEAHWEYFEASVGKQLFWDGVDQRGEWNTRQSSDYGETAHGAFELDQKPIIGKGFYVWNEEQQAGKPGLQALIAGDRNSDGTPVFGHGTFATWYVRIECRDRAGTPRSIGTDNPNPRGAYNPMKTGTAGLVYTHLPEPTRMELTILDSAGSWSETGDPDAGSWGTPDGDATINNTKPVKLRFTVQARPGSLWSGNQNEVSVKLTRQAHLRATIFDLFQRFTGSNYPGQTVLERAIVSRRLTNDSHTLSWEDDGYRKAKTFKQSDSDPDALTQWIFIPKYFKKNFRGVENEVLQFGDYLQLEEVPGWDASRSIAGVQSRYLIGFINYLFYLSAFTQDRSGRMVWCLDRHFLDKAKITGNAYGDWWAPGSPGTAATSSTYRNTWPEDPIRQHRRTVVTRQWADEGTWQADQRSKWGFSTGSLGDKLLRHKWKDHDVTSTTLAGAAWPTLDTDEHSKWFRDSSRTDLPAGFANLTRQLGSSAGGTRLSGTHSWTWTDAGSGNLWIPCITRDFAGFYFLPPMIDWHTVYVDYYAWVSDTDAAAAETWSSPVWDMTQTYDASASGKKRFWRGHKVEPGKDPTSVVNANTMDYLRQDDMVHYEELRGTYSRGPKPGQQPKKITPSGPYYVNPYWYSSIYTDPAYNNPAWPIYSQAMVSFFDMKFRSEYLWESGSLFPVNYVGKERLEAVMWERAGWNVVGRFWYDDGAWAGWKDDSGGSVLLSNKANVFSSSYMPVAVGPKMSGITMDMIFHMVLLNERRITPV